MILFQFLQSSLHLLLGPFRVCKRCSGTNYSDGFCCVSSKRSRAVVRRDVLLMGLSQSHSCKGLLFLMIVPVRVPQVSQHSRVNLDLWLVVEVKRFSAVFLIHLFVLVIYNWNVSSCQHFLQFKSVFVIGVMCFFKLRSVHNIAYNLSLAAECWEWDIKYQNLFQPKS